MNARLSKLHLVAVVLFTFTGALAGCSSDSSTTNTNGTPPTLSNLTFTPASVTSTKAEAIVISVDFNDPDGDFDAIEGSGTAIGQQLVIPRAAAQTGTKTSGTLPFSLSVPALGSKGTIDVEIWGIDKKGNQSAHQKGTIEVK